MAILKCPVGLRGLFSLKTLVFLLSCFVCVEFTLLSTQISTPKIQTSSKVLLAEKLSRVSVTVIAGNHTGTGIILTRHTKDGKKLHLVLTAAHVVEECRITVTRAKIPQIEFKTAMVRVEDRYDGRVVRCADYPAEIIQYSNAETGRDLAVLKILDPNFPDANTEFYADGIPAPGTDIYHYGSMFGLSGSFTSGVVSQVGRNLEGQLFDQVNIAAYPGSSGGGIFVEDGRCVGLVLLLRAPAVVFIVPAREIEIWSLKAGCRWLTNPSVKVDTDKLSKWPVEND